MHCIGYQVIKPDKKKEPKMKLMALKKELKNIKDLEGHTFPSLGAELSHLEKGPCKKGKRFSRFKKNM